MSIQKINSVDSMAKVQFVGRVGPMGKDKLHVLIPKDKHEEIKDIIGKQVRITIDDEIWT
jgi:hypothetical protein